MLDPSDIDALLNGQVGPADSFRAERHTERTKTFFALQQAFGELHIATCRTTTISWRCAAASSRSTPTFADSFQRCEPRRAHLWQLGEQSVSIQPRRVRHARKGFELGFELLDDRKQEVIVANFYWQDFLWKGYTAQWSLREPRPGIHYDRNGNIVRPAPIGTVRDHDVKRYYLGWAGDGHIGRLNCRTRLPGLRTRWVQRPRGTAHGHQRPDGGAGAFLRRDWIRYKGSLFYASGDGDTEDGWANGFDTIFDNPNFTGGRSVIGRARASTSAARW